MNSTDLIDRIDTHKALKQFKKEGYFFIENAYSADFCNTIIDFVDQYPSEENTEKNYAGSELRIWHAQKKSAQLEKFSTICDDFLSKLFNKKMQTNNLLAIRNKPLTKRDDSLEKGRWHVDSFTNQVKIFLFLTDTHENSGPFEFLPRTQQKWFKLRNIAHYFDLSGLLKNGSRKRKYQRLDDNWVDQLAKQGYKTQPFICKAGTLLIVDTTAIHRARPCYQDGRYALTIYYNK